MTVSSRHALRLVVLLTCPALALGCQGNSSSDPVAQPPTAGPPGPGRWGPPGGGGDSKMKEIMVRIGRGPDSLSSALDRELNAEPPAWEKVEPLATEYATLAPGLEKLTPSKGSKESWAKLCAEFTAAATDLGKSAKARDAASARAAQQTLKNSCNTCHREHRGGPGGRGRPGGPPGPGKE